MLTAARHSADQHTKQPCAGKSSEEERRWLGPWVQCRFRKYSSNWLCKCFIRGRKCGRHVGQTSGLQTPVREPGSKHERSLPGRLRGSLERHGDAARLKFTAPSALSVRVRLFAHRLTSLAFLCNLEHEWTNKPNALTMGIHFCFSEKKKPWDVKSLPSNRTQLVDHVCRLLLRLSCSVRTPFCLSVGLKHL